MIIQYATNYLREVYYFKWLENHMHSLIPSGVIVERFLGVTRHINGFYGRIAALNFSC